MENGAALLLKRHLERQSSLHVLVNSDVDLRLTEEAGEGVQLPLERHSVPLEILLDKGPGGCFNSASS